MRSVIYMCCFGSPLFKEMTRLCIHSLRSLGKYSGLVIVFTNNGYRAQDKNVQVIAMPHELSLYAIREFKAAARRFIDGREFEAVMSMDTDMIAIRDIRPLLKYSDSHICGMRESPWTRMSDISCNTCLTPQERRQARRHWGINAGLLCTPGPLFESYMASWEAEIRAHRRRLTTWINQPPFNALVLRRHVRFKGYPRRWIDMPPLYHLRGQVPTVTTETRVLHYCWPSKHLALLEMEHALQGMGALG